MKTILAFALVLAAFLIGTLPVRFAQGTKNQTTTAPDKAKDAAKPESAKPATRTPTNLTHEEALEIRLSDANRENLNHQFTELQQRFNAWAADRAGLNNKLQEKYKIDLGIYTLSPSDDVLMPVPKQ